MWRRAFDCGLIAIALLAAGACSDDEEAKPRTVDLAGSPVASEDAGSSSAAATQPGAGNDAVGPVATDPDDGSDTAVDPRDAAANKGTLPKEAIGDVFDRGTPAVRKCYERELKRTPTLAGRLSFNIKIGRTGKVETVRLRSSTLKNKVVERCIVATIKKWKFAKPTGGTVLVTYPISFSAKNN